MPIWGFFLPIEMKNFQQRLVAPAALGFVANGANAAELKIKGVSDYTSAVDQVNSVTQFSDEKESAPAPAASKKTAIEIAKSMEPSSTSTMATKIHTESHSGQTFDCEFNNIANVIEVI